MARDSVGSEVAALEFAVDTASPGDAGQQPQDSLKRGVGAGQAQLSHLEHQRRVERVAGTPFPRTSPSAASP